MKPKTKKIIIIVAAVAIVAAIAYFVFRRKKSASNIVAGLAITDDQKTALLAKVAEIEANTSNNPSWTQDALKNKASEKGYTYAQWVVVEAAYALYYTSNWSLYNTIVQSVKTL